MQPAVSIACNPLIGGDQTGGGFYSVPVGKEGVYEIWTWREGTVVRDNVFARPKNVFNITIVQDGRYMGHGFRKGVNDAILVLNSFETGEVVKEWKPPDGWEFQSIEAGLSSNGKLAAVVLAAKPNSDPDETERHRVGRIDLRTLELAWVGELSGRGAPTIRRIAVSDDGRFIAVGGWDNGVALVDASEKKVLWSGRSPMEVSTGYVRFSSDGLTLYTAGSEGCVYTVDTITGRRRGRLWATDTGRSLYGHRISSLAISPDGRWLAAGTGPQGRVYLWDITSPAPKPRTLPHGGGTVFIVEFSPDSQRLASVANGTIKIWNVKASTEDVEGK